MSDHPPDAGTLVDAARDLMARIRYQVFIGDGTTMGQCPRCGDVSRGSRVCALCLGRELDAILPPGEVWPEGALGRRYLHACNMLRLAERDVLRRAGDGRG